MSENRTKNSKILHDGQVKEDNNYYEHETDRHKLCKPVTMTVADRQESNNQSATVVTYGHESYHDCLKLVG